MIDYIDKKYYNCDLFDDPTGFLKPSSLLIGLDYNPTNRTMTLSKDTTAYFKGRLIPELVPGWTSTAHPVFTA